MLIDRETNEYLTDLSNRQGIQENKHYLLFIKIIIAGISEFERYRQSIIRSINKKNKPSKESSATIVNRILKDPNEIKNLSERDAKTFVDEIKSIKKESDDYEDRYRYDVRILNVLATSGLKATSIAHELQNDRNSFSVCYDYIVSALKEYNFWDDLNSSEHTEYSYKNIPQLLKRNKDISEKVLIFMDTMLDKIEKQKFSQKRLSVQDILGIIKSNWERDYACLDIILNIDDDLFFDASEDVFTVIFDNLILNSLQQNSHKNKIKIIISIKKIMNHLDIRYSDDGVGLPQKYINDPTRILIVHETSRKNGHGLGMWIVHNTAIMTGGLISSIDSQDGFGINIQLGG